MMNRDMVKGLTFYEQWRHRIVELFQFGFGKGKTGAGFASDEFILLLSIRCSVKTFFQTTPGTQPAAIADIGRLGKGRANIFFIVDAGGNTFAAGPAKFVVRVSTGMAELLERALMEEGGTTVIEGSA